MDISILSAMINIANNPIHSLQYIYISKNRANSMGEALEMYIKDIFANTINETSEIKRNQRYNQVFSYLGNQNNPPDIIISNGDAIEVKKIESKNSGIALNSSYPKAMLYSDSQMITEACRTCENWTEKDIIYAVGVVNDNQLKSLCFIYGIDYAASSNIYERIKNAISTGILSIPDIEFSETNELGRVNRVDPLGVTYLRIRGMWHIQNPMKTFSYIYNENQNSSFNFMAIINDNKYKSFGIESRKKFEDELKKNNNFNMVDVKIKEPDNPSILRGAKLITFSV
ncbi:MAG: NgoPII family restriction endonuclease [Vulcanibacillus sp.]